MNPRAIVKGLAAFVSLSGAIVAVSGATASPRMVPSCGHAALHAGSCVEPFTGRLAMLVDARASDQDRCRATAVGGGDERVLCRYDGSDWREFSRRAATDPSNPAQGAADLVFDILDPPPESGLVPPVGDGRDGAPHAARTDDAPAITAAIQYACDHGYDIAYLGPGTYRIGQAGTGGSFYTGIRIDAKRCPGGIRFYGAGVGRTVLLANGEAGQYLIFTTDQYENPTKVLRIGWNVYGDTTNKVTGITTGVVPPVIHASEDGHLEDGDSIYVRNCSGTVQANDRMFEVANCSEAAPYGCELQDESGVDIDATGWSPWTSASECIVNKLNDDFDVEIAYMTLRDDDPSAHSTTVCDPECAPANEESHGIGILQSGGVVEVHHVLIDSVGDEAIDIGAAESPTYVHDVTILNPEVGGTPIYQGVGVRIQDVLVHKDPPRPTESFPYSAGDGFAADTGRHNWRIVDLAVERMVITGRLRQGFNILTNATGIPGQYISGVRVSHSAVHLAPLANQCSSPLEACGSLHVQSSPNAFPMEDIEISDNALTGTAYLQVETGEGGVVLRGNTLTPISTIGAKWGVLAASRRTTIADNLISGFTRGCIQYQPYETQGGAHGSVTTAIERNVLRCVSNATNHDPAIGTIGALGPEPAEDDEAYLRIVDNTITVTSSGFVRYGAYVPHRLPNVEICRNRIAFDPALPFSGLFGIWSSSPDQVICDNEITLKGTGIRVDAEGSKIVGNRVDGFDAAFGDGILAYEASGLLVLRNELDGYRSVFSNGIRAVAGDAGASGIEIIGNRIGPAGSGIYLEGEAGGLDDVSVGSNVIDLSGLGAANAILIEDTTNARITLNDLLGLTASNSNGLLTTGTTDYILVRGNLAQGGAKLRFGSAGGDASCEPTGVGAHSVCSDNDLE